MHKRATPKAQSSAPGPVRGVDVFLLILLAVIVGARCQINETFPSAWQVGPTEQSVGIGGPQVPTMLIFAGLIWSSALLWGLVRLARANFDWRKTSMLCGFFVMGAAGVVSTVAASNRHAAIIGVINFLSQIVLAILLVQLLDAGWKRRLLLCVLAATGVTMAYRCWEQKTYDAPQTAEVFLQDPEAALGFQGMEPGTYAAQQFMDRILSEDIGGFFAISNTAASFFILSILATLALLAEKLRVAAKEERITLWIVGFMAAGVQVLGLWITQSKGGIGGFALALGAGGILWWGRGFLRRRWKGVLASAVVLTILSAAALASIGSSQGRLPGNSMWVRWQYWEASAKMIADHWFAGVGAENFGTYYPRYMDPAAPEVVKDPHSFPVALWSQWGVLGLAGFSWLALGVSVGLAKPVRRRDNAERIREEFDPPARMKWLTSGVIIGGIVLIRWLTTSLGESPVAEKANYYLIALVVPALIWLAAFSTMYMIGKIEPAPPARGDSSLSIVLLGAGLLGFLAHNSVDFALFHPGVGTWCFAVAALALSMRGDNDAEGAVQINWSVSRRLPAAIMGLVVVGGLWGIIIPTISSQQSMASAQRWAAQGAYRQCLAAAQRAARLDRRDPGPPEFLGILYSDRWRYAPVSGDPSFNEAVRWLEASRQRDRAGFRAHRLLFELYLVALEVDPQNISFAERALAHGQEAAARLRANSELRLKYARLLSQQSRVPEAIDHLEQALENERIFLVQQQTMYPTRSQATPRLRPELRQEAEALLSRLRQ